MQTTLYAIVLSLLGRLRRRGESGQTTVEWLLWGVLLAVAIAALVLVVKAIGDDALQRIRDLVSGGS